MFITGLQLAVLISGIPRIYLTNLHTVMSIVLDTTFVAEQDPRSKLRVKTRESWQMDIYLNHGLRVLNGVTKVLEY
jgi:hypothetical protein